MNPYDALIKYGQELSAYEHKEIVQYPQVWYLGLNAEKVIGYNKSAPNNGIYICYYMSLMFCIDGGIIVNFLHFHLQVKDLLS